MERIPSAAVSGCTHQSSTAVQPARRGETTPGQPRQHIDDEHLAQLFKDIEQARAIRRRRDRPTPFKREPFLSRFGKWAYAAIDWFCFGVLVCVPALLVICIIVAVARS